MYPVSLVKTEVWISNNSLIYFMNEFLILDYSQKKLKERLKVQVFNFPY
jgi:hypothetical protein